MKVSCRIRIVFAGLVLFGTSWDLRAQSTHEFLRKGDRQYDKKEFNAAEKHYRSAADLKYGDPKALYNLGNSLYQQGQWEDAAQRFDLAAQSFQDADGKANALHNMGNALMQLHRYQEAAMAYEKSLRLRPADEGTKKNLQMAKKKIKEQQQQQQQQQNNQQQNQDQQDQQQNKQQNQNDQQQQDQQQQQQQQQNQSGQQQQPQQQPQQEQPEPGKMDKETARKMLETAVGPEDQRNARKYRAVQQKRQNKHPKKDW